MGFITPGISPGGGGGLTSAASIDAALTAARASGSDGDAYEVSSTALRFYKPAGTPGIIVPAWLYAAAQGLVSGADGDGYLDSDDSEADLTGRGWVIAEDGNGTVTGGDGSPWTLASGTGGGFDQGKLTFTASSQPTYSALVLKVSDISGTTVSDTRVAVQGGTGAASGPELRTSLTNGAAGTLACMNNNAIEADAIGAATVPTDGWLVMLLKATDTDSVAAIAPMLGDPGVSIACEVSDLRTVTNKITVLSAQEVGGEHSFKIHAAYWIELG